MRQSKNEHSIDESDNNRIDQVSAVTRLNSIPEPLLRVEFQPTNVHYRCYSCDPRRRYRWKNSYRTKIIVPPFEHEPNMNTIIESSTSVHKFDSTRLISLNKIDRVPHEFVWISLISISTIIFVGFLIWYIAVKSSTRTKSILRPLTSTSTTHLCSQSISSESENDSLSDRHDNYQMKRSSSIEHLLKFFLTLPTLSPDICQYLFSQILMRLDRLRSLSTGSSLKRIDNFQSKIYMILQSQNYADAKTKLCHFLFQYEQLEACAQNSSDSGLRLDGEQTSLIIYANLAVAIEQIAFTPDEQDRCELDEAMDYFICPSMRTALCESAKKCDQLYPIEKILSKFRTSQIHPIHFDKEKCRRVVKLLTNMLVHHQQSQQSLLYNSTSTADMMIQRQ